MSCSQNCGPGMLSPTCTVRLTLCKSLRPCGEINIKPLNLMQASVGSITACGFTQMNKIALETSKLLIEFGIFESLINPSFIYIWRCWRNLSSCETKPDFFYLYSPTYQQNMVLSFTLISVYSKVIMLQLCFHGCLKFAILTLLSCQRHKWRLECWLLNLTSIQKPHFSVFEPFRHLFPLP